MKVVDIHPEELIDKLVAGAISAAERERLDAHLEQCSGCRFEIGVRADLAEDAPLIEGRPQLAFAGSAAAERTLTPRPAARVAVSVRPRSRRRWPLVMLAAALVLCAGGATAAVVTGAVPAPWRIWSPEPNAAQVASSAAATKLAHQAKRAAPKPVATNEASGAQPAASDSAAPAAATASVTVAPAAPAAPARAEVHLAQPRATTRVSSNAAFPVVADVAPGGASPAEASPPRADPAAALFADANRARRDGNAERAVVLYRSLQSRYPSSAESELSRALLAQLLLERGNPEAALVGFDRYLAEGAPVLGAEALVGRARALEQLNKSTQAAAAWQEVQRRFPGSVHARLAATRLAALGMR